MRLSKASFRRLDRVVGAVEKRRVYLGDHPRPRYFAGQPLVLSCVVSATISAKSGTTMGTGQVTLMVTNADSGTETVGSDVLTVYNSYHRSFPADATKSAKVHFEGGVWKFLTREC